MRVSEAPPGARSSRPLPGRDTRARLCRHGAGGCALVSEEWLASWAGSVVSSAPHSSQLGGGSPGPLPGRAAQRTLR